MTQDQKDFSMAFNDPVRNMSLTYDEIHAHARGLAKLLAPKGPWKGLVAVSTGGMIPATIVARNLGIKDVPTFCITRYNGVTEGELKIIRMPQLQDGGDGWLVIDDLADKGNTLRLIHDHLPKAHIATLYVKPAGRDVVDTHFMDIDQNTWMHYPWEDNEETYLSPAALLAQAHAKNVP